MLAAEARDHEHYDEWYPDTGDLEVLLGEAGVLLDEAPDAVRELADFVIDGIERVLDFGSCYGADLADALARAQDLHLDACLAGWPDPARLAERLFRGALESGWGSFDDALPGYAEVLGAAGMARYEELLAHVAGPACELRGMRESLARARGGTDAVVDVLAQQAGKPEDFARIAEILIAEGRGMPKKPVTSTDELTRMLWQAEASMSEVLVQQMLDRFAQQTFVGGKRLALQKLPRLPNKNSSGHARGGRIRRLRHAAGGLRGPDGRGVLA
jgi:hypothetical protein